MPASIYLISDIHLGAAPAGVERELLGFLRALKGRASTLVVNGDLFDFWFEWKTVIPRGAFRTLAALSELRESGTEVIWIAGNHDCWGGDVLRKDVGVDYRMEAWEGDLAGWRTRIEHGDGLRDREDKAYRRLRTILRSPLSIRLFSWLHPDLATKVATATSHTSRDHRARDEGSGLRSVGHAALAVDPKLDLLVYAHSHVAMLERVGRGVFANAGSWLDAPTYLALTERAIELHRWDGSLDSEPDLALERE
ncbi:MAG: UDP-2,3-diacylglucosamine diphosphatase [Gemmatimonadaceae bacterium]